MSKISKAFIEDKFNKTVEDFSLLLNNKKHLLSNLFDEYEAFRVSFKRKQMHDKWADKFPALAKAIIAPTTTRFQDDLETFGMCRISEVTPPVGETVQISDGKHVTMGIWWGLKKKFEIARLSSTPGDFEPEFWVYVYPPDTDL